MMLARGGPLPEAQALDWISQVCDALADLHQQIPPLYHTDIKPANIRITPEGQAILVDLGTLREPDAETHGATALGINAAFIAPEVADQGAWDEQSDIYALGVTLFTLLTGKPPSEADKRTPGFARRFGISPRVGLLIERSMRGDKAVCLENVHDFRKILVEASTSRMEALAIPPALESGRSGEGQDGCADLAQETSALAGVVIGNGCLTGAGRHFCDQTSSAVWRRCTA